MLECAIHPITYRGEGILATVVHPITYRGEGILATVVKYQKSDSQTIYGRKICESPFLFHLRDVYLFLFLKQ